MTKKHLHNAGDRAMLWHFRTASGLEVDFVVESGGVVQGIEVKANATPVHGMGDTLVTWRKLLGRRAGRTRLVCDCATRTSLGRDVGAVPWREAGAVCAAL